MIVKKILGIVAVLLLSTAAASAQTVHKVWEPPFKHGIAAIVEDRIVTFEQLRREMAPLVPEIRTQSRSPREFEQRMNQLYLEVLQSLVDTVLVVKDFYSDEKRQIPSSYVEDEYDRILNIDYGGDRQKFLEMLRSEGKTVREFRRDLQERIVVSVWTGHMRKSLAEISPEKIAGFYNQNRIHFFQEESVHLRLIMLKPLADEPKDLLRQTADQAIAELDSGIEFESVAKKYSQDSKAPKGGDWGWINRADLRDELSSVAFELDPGSYSQPVELLEQIFILYVEDRNDEGIQPLDEVRERIEDILASQLSRQAQKRWKERLRKDAYVKYY